MSLRIVRLGSPRAAGEGLRIGTVRRPPRGVRKSEFASGNWYDVWLPLLAPSTESVALARNASSAKDWAAFVKRYTREMSATDAQQALNLLAALSHTSSFCMGCYCEDASRCHRSVLKDLLIAKGADVEQDGAAGVVSPHSAAATAATAAAAAAESNRVALPTLVGTRCTLRALRDADAPSIARHADDPQVAFNLFDGFPQPYTLALAQAWCSHHHRRPFYGHVFAIDVDGEAIGCCSIRPDKGAERCNAEAGYWIGRAFWRRGITSEALRSMSAWAWQALPDISRLYAPIYARNAGSQGAARSAGYVLEGCMPMSGFKDGVVIDRVVYAAYRKGG